MPEIVISDTSCLILLQKINHLSILKNLYSSVVVTSIIAGEFNEDLPTEIIIRDAKDQNTYLAFAQVVDKGEASAFALALELSDCMVILDDRKARNFARNLNIKITGTLGILVKAKRKGIIKGIETFTY